ncbi:YfiH family protein [Desulfonema limicola]|uniref:Purine nucleoside phosphorylase n=1 Tax=Desulfonema limicola TaxID=45656 RepID=A0A975BDR8_9BACT|nr:peptidoglycan editing factor PgeF [Desulfonema limicola]QTA83390.1 YfiH family protein [Desulfonema limicola]
MINIQKNGLSFFQFPNLAEYPGICHGIFTRKGGVSSQPYDSLNTSLNSGDLETNVIKNRSLILQCLEIDNLFFINQVHGTDIVVLNKKDCQPPDYPVTGDAVISNIPGKNIVIQTADCQAVLLYDAHKQTAANIHAGWRGSIQNIIGKTIQKMEKIFKCNPAHITAGIGPALGLCCAEFINYKKEIPEKYWKYKNNSNHFDFYAVSRDQLCNAGVLPENIFSSSFCTKCSSSLFFSFRKNKTTGRFASIIGIK